jgi:DNA processing protein
LEELKALIGLKMCDGIGDITANKLLMACGSAAGVFEEKNQHLSGIPGITSNIAETLRSGINWGLVDKEVDFIEKNHINLVSILDRAYPQKLIQIDSPPPILFFSGSIEPLNTAPCISIVGTRMPTSYGKEFLQQLIAALKDLGVVVISGLAYGIDITAHKESIQNNVITYGVVAHGLKTVYPAAHRPYVGELIRSGGGIISDYFSEEIPNRENFPKRNRIIAGLSSATLVIEASHNSGTLITADQARSFKRKVFALPGRYMDKSSEGCNYLLSKPGVMPILSVQSLIDDLGVIKKPKPVSSRISVSLEPQEKQIMCFFSNVERINLDDLSSRSQLKISECASILFNLEMKGLIRSLPGKTYELCPF